MQDGTVQDFDNNYSLLSPLISEAVAVKEDRRIRKNVPSANASSAEASEAAAASENPASESVPMEEGAAESESAEGGAVVVKPSTIQLV